MGSDKRIWMHKTNSFDDAERYDEDYYLNMSSLERLETMQLLREIHFKMIKKENEGREGLRRTIKIIKQT